MVFLLQQRCKNNKSFSIQVLSRNIVAFSVLDDDDLPVFNHFLNRRLRVFLVAVFINAEV